MTINTKTTMPLQPVPMVSKTPSPFDLKSSPTINNITRNPIPPIINSINF